MATLDPTKTFFSPDNTGGLLKQVDDSATADNIFIFADGTRRFKWIANQKGEYPLSQAKVLAGDTTDKTAIVQAVLNHTDVKTIVLDAQQIVTINGILNCNGKKIVFTSGAKITGTGEIQNAVIMGDDNDQLFDTTIKLSTSKSGKEYFSAKWFGALGNGSNIDTEALQKVLDTCVNNKTRRIFFPTGTYKIDKGIYVRLGNTSDVFAENITIEGPVVTVNGAGTEASIVCTNPNSFALGLQRVKGAKVKNLSFIGPNHAMDTFKLYDVIQNPAANFSAGMRDERTSPNAGIVIDPFSHSGHTSMYPGFEALYTEVQRGGSTDVIIENCDVKHFVVNYMISPTGYLQNAERITIRDCWGDRCKSAIAVGQHQTRSVYVENFGCWVKTETVLDAERYGEGTGCPPDVNGLNIAGGVRYVCRLNNWFSNGMHIVNMHAEELGSLGGNFSSAIGKLTIKDSFIDIIGGMTANALTGASIQAAITQFQGDYLVLENCTIHSYSNNISVPINVAVNNAVFTNCTLGLIPFSQGGSGQIAFNNCSLISNAIPFGDGHIFYGNAPAEIPYADWPFMTKMEWFTGMQVPSLKRVKRERIHINGWRQSKGIELIAYDTQITLSSIDLDSLEATFNIPSNSEFFKFLQVNDLLITYVTDEFGKVVPTKLGYVLSKNASTGDITLKYVVKGASLATPYYLLLYKQEVLIAPLIIGDLASGTNTITNVLLENYADRVPIGVTINHKLLPIGTYIVSYDHSTGTITLSNNATGTATRQTFVSSDWEGLQIGVPDLYHPRRIGYKIGDKIINDDFITYPNVLHWTCTKPGVTGSPLLPEFAVTNL